jgi:hypothetical protein
MESIGSRSVPGTNIFQQDPMDSTGTQSSTLAARVEQEPVECNEFHWGIVISSTLHTLFIDLQVHWDAVEDVGCRWWSNAVWFATGIQWRSCWHPLVADAE